MRDWIDGVVTAAVLAALILAGLIGLAALVCG